MADLESIITLEVLMRYLQVLCICLCITVSDADGCVHAAGQCELSFVSALCGAVGTAGDRVHVLHDGMGANLCGCYF